MEQQMDTYGSFEAEILEVLDKNHCITLSTTGNDGVRSRTVDYVNSGLDIIFFTWNYTRKVADIRNNPKVALCLNSIEIEGVAKIFDLNDEKINGFKEEYYKKLPELFEKFINLPDTIMVTVISKVIIRMEKSGDTLSLNQFDLESNKLIKTKLSDW